jgi:hypothetical protein
LGTLSWTGLASAGLASAGPGGTWGQALVVPGAAALVTGGIRFDGAVATAISCTSPGNCTAVGSYFVSDPDTNIITSWPLVVRESDGAWGNAAGLQGIAGLSAGLGGQLTRISCASAGNCSAAGSYVGPGNTSFGFLADEVSGAWGPARALPDAASLGTQGSGINAISCPSAGNCVAVGAHFGTQFILDEVKGSWGDPLAVPGVANLGTASNAGLDSVSCPAAGDCTAIGTVSGSGGRQAEYPVLADPGAAASGRGGTQPGSR